MLRRLRVENLVLIREADLELAPGLNAITGETGAGKTILAQAVGLPPGNTARRWAGDGATGLTMTADIEIRHATPDDANGIAALYDQVYDGSYPVTECTDPSLIRQIVALSTELLGLVTSAMNQKG